MRWALPFIALVAAAVAANTAAQADLDAAREAARRGDHARAYRELVPLARAGDVDAQYYLGGLYYKGEGVEQDYGKAAEWFGRSADRGNAKAQTDLAQCYLFGFGVEKDSETAVTWYRRAAAHMLGGARLCPVSANPRSIGVFSPLRLVCVIHDTFLILGRT